MSISIYYFTGTGNSLKISKELASRFDDAQIIPMTAAIRAGAIEGSDTIVLVFPVYMYGLPRIVGYFIKKFSNQMKNKYIAALAVNGGTVAGTLLSLKRQLKAKGLDLSAGFSVKTPSNFIVEFTVEEDEIVRIFEESEKKVDAIASVIKSGAAPEIEKGTKKDCIVKTDLLNRCLAPLIPVMDTTFKTTSACIGCGICTKVCPVNNITLKNGAPKWHHRCQQCFACINNCPCDAIEYMKLSVGKKRYHNPYIKLEELMKK
ncbi:MAG: EFR1 family ferrodoxin [Lacrimispora sp.]